MNPALKIIAKRSVEIAVPLTAAWIAWKKLNARPLKLSAPEAALAVLGISLHFAGALIGSWRFGYPDFLTELPIGRRGRRSIALTFDDGPDPETTPRILDALRAADAKASFFIVADLASKHPELVARMIEEGHAVGLHGMDHQPMVFLTQKQVRFQLYLFERSLRPLLWRVRYFRPPYGFKSRNLIVGARQIGMQVVNWSLDPKDYEDIPEDELVRRVMGRIRTGDIVLLHEGRRTTAAALPTLLKRLRGREFTPVAL